MIGVSVRQAHFWIALFPFGHKRRNWCACGQSTLVGCASPLMCADAEVVSADPDGFSSPLVFKRHCNLLAEGGSEGIDLGQTWLNTLRCPVFTRALIQWCRILFAAVRGPLLQVLWGLFPNGWLVDSTGGDADRLAASCSGVASMFERGAYLPGDSRHDRKWGTMYGGQ
jgi:hypothetical protein